ncbi:hypothetical protein ACIRBX_12945 [Kitasatospora sp. NPDC096147]|uniref:hypothetical protein n=1 Tax=Kitasatospora sp. NPDC096147 TaxID=3364093 RepID=UPI00380DF29A
MTKSSNPALRPRVGELVTDTRSGRVGEYRDTLGRAAYLRPVGGGCEWETDPSCLETVSNTEERAS